MQLSGWGNFPSLQADLLAPTGSRELQTLLQKQDSAGKLICRGGGRSYGDSALNDRVLSSRYLDHFLKLDQESGAIRCGSGVSLQQLLDVVITHGLFPTVLPGTKQVSVGGAIAADIHGKNHHVDGSFCDHVSSLTLMTADGSLVECSPTENAELFHATCGGMGLTGVIVDATIQLSKVASVSINTKRYVASNLDQCLELLDQHNDAKYVVAWLDCLAQGEELGRSIVYVGEHSDDGNFELVKRPRVTVPFTTPGFLLNKFSMGLFNKTYFGLQKNKPESFTQNYEQYFFPLDSIGHWNRLYGGKGFLQYQFVVPTDAKETLKEILHRVSQSGQGSFLSVLKRFGPANKNLLSFPDEGYTLTLDFRWRESLFSLLDELDELVLACGGRHYLAKDARLGEASFKAGYPRWQEFVKIKEKVDPEGRFASLQSNRLGLTMAPSVDNQESSR